MELIHIKESKVHEDDDLLKELFMLAERLSEVLDQIEERGCVYEYVRKSD